MQPLPPEFLTKLARDYDLALTQEEAFVKRFSTNGSNFEVAKALCISESAFGSRMCGVYGKFSIPGPGPGKQRRLHDFLLRRYQQSNPSTLTADGNEESEIDELVREVRSRCCNKIRTTCNFIQLYNRSSIHLHQLFVPILLSQ